MTKRLIEWHIFKLVCNSSPVLRNCNKHRQKGEFECHEQNCPVWVTLEEA